MMMYQKPEVSILGDASSVIQSQKDGGSDNLAEAIQRRVDLSQD
jgi:hypothetical protein